MCSKEAKDLEETREIVNLDLQIAAMPPQPPVGRGHAEYSSYQG